MAHSTAKSSPAPVAVTKTSATAGKTSGRRRARTPAKRPSATPLAKERTEFLAGIVGGAELARMLGVSRSQPTRWRSGAE